jgi:hypothetical protein
MWINKHGNNTISDNKKKIIPQQNTMKLRESPDD